MAKGNKLSNIIKTTAPCDMSMPRSMSTQDKMRERKYRAEDAIRTLQRAEEIRKDKTLMRDVKTVAQEQMKQLQTVAKASGRR